MSGTGFRNPELNQSNLDPNYVGQYNHLQSQKEAIDRRRTQIAQKEVQDSSLSYQSPPRVATEVPEPTIPLHSSCTTLATLTNSDTTIQPYRNPPNTPMTANFVLSHNPKSDEAFAHNIYLRTYFAKFVGALIFIVVIACIIVIAVDSKNEYETMVMDETMKIENCVKTYEENRCHPHQRVPALNNFCLDLEICMNSDPRKIAKRSAAFSSLVADNANKLFGHLKLQTVIVICILLFGSIISCNLFFAGVRPNPTHAPTAGESSGFPFGWSRSNKAKST